VAPDRSEYEDGGQAIHFSPDVSSATGLARFWPRGLGPHAASCRLDPVQRITYVKRAVVLGFAAGFLLSARLWMSHRFYPLIPISPLLPHLPPFLDYILFGLLLGLLVGIEIFSNPRIAIYAFAALLLLLAVFDQTRWQPWAYLYLFLLLALVCFSGKSDDVQSAENSLNICRLMVVATYFYSGLQKLNPHFAAGMASLAGHMARRWPELQMFGWLMAGVETGIALALLTHRFRNLAVACGIVMHGFVLLVFGFVYRWNSVIWPWNVVMMALLVLLFWNTDFSFLQVIWANPLRFQKFALLLFGLLPALSFFGWWDSYLSASLYSANIPMANIFMSHQVKNQLPQRIQRYVKQLPEGDVLKIQDWALGELNVPPYPAARVYRALGAEICRYSHNSPDVMLVLQEKDTLLSKGTLSRDTCFGTLVVEKW